MGLAILLVEDNRLNQELARDLLEVAGHRVEVAEDGATLWAKLERIGTPDLILLDILLPGSDGLTLLRELRTKSGAARVPVVAITAHALAGDIERFVAAGFDGVLTKPINTRTFVSEIERYASAARR